MDSSKQGADVIHMSHIGSLCRFASETPCFSVNVFVRTFSAG